METILRKIKDMKYRHKLTILLVVASLVPMTVLALYSHSRMSRLIRSNEMEDMSSILEQTREGIDSQIEVFTSLINYLTYSPDIEDIIQDKDMDNYTAYEKYTNVADPLLTVPKSYHDAIHQIQLFAESIKVRHEYTLIPLSQADRQWWFSRMSDDVQVQWLVDEKRQEIVAARRIFQGSQLDGVLCITLDYGKIFQSFNNIITSQTGGIIADKEGNILYHQESEGSPVSSRTDNVEAFLEELGEDYACVSCESSENGWKFYLYRPQSAIDGSVSRLLLSEIPLIAVCVLIILALGLSFSRLFTRRVEALTENMKQMDLGNRQVTVHSDSRDEIGILITTFRSMMAEMDRLIHEVYENKLALKEFELKALTAQINPHFLYNSLSIINWMAIRAGQNEISKVTLALSTFYRTALSKGADMVTVENCITNIKAYLDIQLVMHDNNFQILWDIDPCVNDEMTPKLVLQPVVENALEHGLDMKEEGERILKLSFLSDGEDVLFSVEDNGPGMEPEEARLLVTYQAKGYGLKNVNDRICLLYGEEYALRIYSQVNAGTRVEIRIPKGGKENGK